MPPSTSPRRRGSVLIGRGEAARRMGMSVKRWDGYWPQHPVLVDGCRTVRVDPAKSGRRRWLESALDRHIDSEACR